MNGLQKAVLSGILSGNNVYVKMLLYFGKKLVADAQDPEFQAMLATVAPDFEAKASILASLISQFGNVVTPHPAPTAENPPPPSVVP